MDSKNTKSEATRKPQREQEREQAGSRWADDLNPDRMAGQNLGPNRTDDDLAPRSLFDVKELHARYRDLGDEALKRVPVLPPGTRLQAGATYVDLAEERPRELTTDGGVTAGDGHWYVPKDRVSYLVWNRLIGEVKPPNERER